VSRYSAMMRRLVPSLAAIVLLVSMFFITQGQAVAYDSTRAAETAAKYKFAEMSIAMPAGYESLPKKTTRPVNPAYDHIVSWISSVGASIAINDLTGHGRPDSMCIVDTRTNDVIVTWTPTAQMADRFTPFVLNPAPLPVDDTMAPTGCTPGDFNGDGSMDLLVTYWGRTPILFMARSNIATLSQSTYRPVELVPEVSVDGKYHGPRWNTDADYVGDLDGSGHPDIVIGNYFPESDVLDPAGLDNVQMNQSLSSAINGGGDHILRWYSATSGAEPAASYVEAKNPIPYDASSGWTLAVSGADLTGDGLPELYIANDFGHDHLLYNESTPGNIQFKEALGQRTPVTPKSFVLGNGSFKGMGVDFGDINRNGKFDIMVSNITTKWGLQESNFVFINQAKDNAEMRHDLETGVAPFTQEAQQYGLAWTGWCWDVKMGDFLNDGNLAMVQTDGFVKGATDRWNWLQEMAMTNDDLLSNPAMWPNVQPGDDIAGDQALAFYAKGSDGKYVNISSELGLAAHTPTRGIATADTTGDGALDFAVARQWGPPAFYANQSVGRGEYLDLRLLRPAVGSVGGQGIADVGSPAYGATVQVTTPSGTQISQLDGGGGHGGFRTFDIHFGLGAYARADVRLEWRGRNGVLHREKLGLPSGSHTLLLTNTAQEAPTR
jgi:hypothetical protein